MNHEKLGPTYRLSEVEAKNLVDIANKAIASFKGDVGELESAIGMLFIGQLCGWRVLVIVHNKRTIRKYEEILGIKVREFFPEEGPMADRSLGYRMAKSMGKYWKVVSGEVKIEGRRELE